MGYVNAEQVLPQALIEEIQQYVDGEYMYIPRKAENRKRWGTANAARRTLQERNEGIYAQYAAGEGVKTLSARYYLSPKTIERIVMRQRRLAGKRRE